ncbi:MAG: DUF2157 domain-containing protein [Cyclobacteriaceae bacterium]|nr:DUF2157 domain-containing protein [Cyclobacteriaceae bacterium]
MMIRNTPRDLLEKGFISETQFNKIEPIVSGKIVSVYYELRTMLYLGVLLFSGGIGILIYENIGSLGHIISILLLSAICLTCFWYVFKKGLPFSVEKAKPPTPYFDYIVLLGSLLFISVQGYLQFQYELLTDNLGWSTLITAAFFFYIAYRFDNLGILSLAITALASFWSISISPQKWYSNEFFETANLHITAIFFGLIVGTLAMVLDWKSIKKHFTFTYINFSILIFFVGAIAGLFEGDYYIIYLLLIYAGCAFAVFYANRERSFLFLLYAFVFGYIGTTYLMSDLIFDAAPELIFYYAILSCGGFVYFIVSYKNFFTRKT